VVCGIRPHGLAAGSRWWTNREEDEFRQDAHDDPEMWKQVAPHAQHLDLAVTLIQLSDVTESSAHVPRSTAHAPQVRALGLYYNTVLIVVMIDYFATCWP